MNMINGTHVEGYLYQHNLEEKVSGPNSKNPGTKFISGTMDIATDNAMLNVVSIHFTYVTPVTAKGTANANYETLSKIINGTLGTVVEAGADKAAKLRVDSQIGVNDFYTERDGETTLVSAKRPEGGFVHVANALAEDESVRNTFKTDMIITKFIRKEANEERNLPEMGIISGFIFDFRKALLPVEYHVYGDNKLNYFEGLNLSDKNPLFTNVWGNIISTTVKRTYTVEGVFGDELREANSTNREFVLNNIKTIPYLWDDESTYTDVEFKKALAEREVYLATVKQRQDEYKASKNAGAIPSATVAAAPASTGGFNF